MGKALSVEVRGGTLRSAGRSSTPSPPRELHVHASTSALDLPRAGASSRARSPRAPVPIPRSSRWTSPASTPRPTAWPGFLGLYDVPTNQTTCGNCHVNNQTEWSGTRHADAYATLASLPAGRGAADLLRLPHRVGARKHLRRCRRARWLELRPRYGLSQRAVRELPRPGTYPRHQPEYHEHPARERPDPVEGRGRDVVGGPAEQGCSACHSDTHHPFAEQWAASSHATLRDGAQAGRRKPPPRAAWRATAAPRRWRS